MKCDYTSRCFCHRCNPPLVQPRQSTWAHVPDDTQVVREVRLDAGCVERTYADGTTSMHANVTYDPRWRR